MIPMIYTLITVPLKIIYIYICIYKFVGPTWLFKFGAGAACCLAVLFPDVLSRPLLCCLVHGTPWLRRACSEEAKPSARGPAPPMYPVLQGATASVFWDNRRKKELTVSIRWLTGVSQKVVGVCWVSVLS